MATKHTQGPWEVEDVCAGAEWGIILGYEIPHAGFPVLLGAVFGGDGPRDPISKSQANANARLVAASPDLLAACRIALADLETWHGERWYGRDASGDLHPQGHCDGCDTCMETIPTLKAAVSKATGEAAP